MIIILFIFFWVHFGASLYKLLFWFCCFYKFVKDYKAILYVQLLSGLSLVKKKSFHINNKMCVNVSLFCFLTHVRVITIN